MADIWIDINGTPARVIINDAMVDGLVRVHSVYDQQAFFQIDEILNTIGFNKKKLQPTFEAYECNSDTFARFLEYFPVIPVKS